MTLSAVIIAAPAAHADDFNPRQDCSKTKVEAEGNGQGSLLGLGTMLDVGAELVGLSTEVTSSSNGSPPIRKPKDHNGTIIDHSFNCSNFVRDSFGRYHFDDHGDHRHHGHHGDHHHDGERD